MSRITTQILILAAVPLGFLLLLLGISVGLQSRNAASAAESQRSAQVLADSARLMMLLDQADRRIAAFQKTKTRSSEQSYDGVIGQIPTTLTDLQNSERSDRANYSLSVRIAQSFERGIGVLNRYVAAVRSGDVREQHRLQTSPDVRKLGAEITSEVTALENAQRKSALQSRDTLRAQMHSFSIALFAVSSVGVAVTLLLFFQFGVSITRRVRLLAQNARRLARGEKTDVIAGNDEISQLDAVYHAMTEQIQGEKARSTALQRALLPQRLPAFPGIRLDASYVPAAGEFEIGGDWYDVFRISDRRVGISIGDVAGHGLRAAAIMATARQGIRTIAYFNDSPASVLAKANEALCRSESGALVTAFFAALDLIDGSLEYSFAGHPPPLIVRTGGAIEHLPGTGFVLGVEPRMEYVTHVARMDIGSALVLYTDGLVETGDDYLQGLRTLEAAVEAEYRDASHNIAEAIQHRVLARRRPRDDSAVLFIGVTALGQAALLQERVVWTIDARSEKSARRVKRALLWHLGELAGNGADLSMSELILSEMLGNVARHTPGPAEVILEWTGDTATIRVFDEGPRFEAPATISAADVLAESGRGLFLLRTMSRDLRVEWTGNGNCVSAVLPLQINDRATLPSAVAM